MTYDEIDPAIRQAYAVHQRLLRLNIPADELFTGVIDGIVRVALQRDGVNLFTIDVCRTTLTEDEYGTAWNQLIEDMQVTGKISYALRERMYDEDWKYSAVQLVAALKAKGLLPSPDAS